MRDMTSTLRQTFFIVECEKNLKIKQTYLRCLQKGAAFLSTATMQVHVFGEASRLHINHPDQDILSLLWDKFLVI